MSLADDLRSAAADHAAALINQEFAAGVGLDVSRLGRAVVEAAAPFLLDADHVDHALNARFPADDATPRLPRPTPEELWRQAGGDEGRYLQLMQQHQWLTLTTIRVVDDRSATE
ncbi:hypothetical protein [Phytohabitans rumicis]|uniref:Uncharacterized protein n=1 Tax=Phytohabitans rumicis TaxID=1076125 RepID=A0A6V8LEH6_9ACTN|nr:hypothetical protein [Phytohabitans rumicis]GFJ93358.1 hypothetical protein Prum_070000 [Phytohabitans rumicis]